MNHDYAHCSDFAKKCPKKCFRAQLVRDLEQQTPYPLRVSYIAFGQTDECPKRKKGEE